jgi:uncharacterized phage-like protein YoqJ
MTANHHIVAFSGHRTYDNDAEELLRTTIHELYAQGARTFRIGMAQGFDLAAGAVVLELMEQHNDIVVEACIPWPTFAESFPQKSRQLYDAIIERATIIRYAGNSYQPQVYHLRNTMLVEGTDVVVAWYDGSKGGTHNTIKMAKKRHCRVINLCPDLQLSMDL